MTCKDCHKQSTCKQLCKEMKVTVDGNQPKLDKIYRKQNRFLTELYQSTVKQLRMY